ncbi:MAG: hypothetical protein M1812_002173 [Candelaria pacifica]|nr:MAG: hypothetical protein M1812_002173 [Candelaria pacifica]
MAESLSEKQVRRFLDKQETLTEEQQNTAKDLKKRHFKLLAKSTLLDHESCRRLFVDFIRVTRPDINPQAMFFTLSSSPPTAAMLKAFATFIAQTSQGLIMDQISVKSLHGYMRNFRSVFYQSTNNTIPKATTEDVSAFIQGPLADQENLCRVRKVKPLTDVHNVELLLSTLYSRSFLETVPNMRDVLNLSLYINLVLDLAAHGGDIAINRKASVLEHETLC